MSSLTLCSVFKEPTRPFSRAAISNTIEPRTPCQHLFDKHRSAQPKTRHPPSGPGRLLIVMSSVFRSLSPERRGWKDLSATLVAGSGILATLRCRVNNFSRDFFETLVVAFTPGRPLRPRQASACGTRRVCRPDLRVNLFFEVFRRPRMHRSAASARTVSGCQGHRRRPVAVKGGEL